MTKNNKNFIRLLLLRWKKLTPFASIQKVYQDNLRVSEETARPFDMRQFSPLREINIIKREIRKIDGKLEWINGSCYTPEELSDEDSSEIYSRFQYMLIEKVKKLIK